MTSRIFLPHTADIKFRVRGATPERVLQEAILATRIAITSARIPVKEKQTFTLQAQSKEELLYRTLEEVLFLFDTIFFLPSKIEKIRFYQKAKTFYLQVTLLGSSPPSSAELTHVKAPTYSEMFFGQQGRSWIIEAVLDV